MYKYTWSFLPKYTWSFLPSAGSPRPQAQLIYMMQLYLHVRNVKQLAYMYMCTCTNVPLVKAISSKIGSGPMASSTYYAALLNNLPPLQ